jgi:hypothetical protein
MKVFGTTFKASLGVAAAAAVAWSCVEFVASGAFGYMVEAAHREGKGYREFRKQRSDAG